MGVLRRTEPLTGRSNAALEGTGVSFPLARLPINPFYLILRDLARNPVGLARSLRVDMRTRVLRDQVLPTPARVNVVALAVDLNEGDGITRASEPLSRHP